MFSRSVKIQRMRKISSNVLKKLTPTQVARRIGASLAAFNNTDLHCVHSSSPCWQFFCFVNRLIWFEPKSNETFWQQKSREGRKEGL
jgi:hypothetical protein